MMRYKNDMDTKHLPASLKKKFRDALRNASIYLVQFFSYFILYIPLRVFFRSRHVLPENIAVLDRGSLLIANHQSIVDPFVVMGNLPFRVFLKLLPVRFPTDHDYMKIPVIGQVLKFFGCYDVGATARLRMCALLKTCDLLRSGETVFLFPEGSIAQSEIQEFSQGIEFFIRETHSVIFVRMDGFNEPIAKHFFASSRSLCYGEVRTIDELEHDARSLRDSFDFLTGHTDHFEWQASKQDI